MPLWMQGFLELLLTTVYSFLIVALIIAAIWFNNGFGSQDFQGVLQLSGNIWLLVHGVPLHLNIPHQGSIAAISGTMAYIPLGLTLVPLFLTFLSGRKLARASYEGQFWVPLLSGLVAYAVVSGGLSYFSSNDIASTSTISAALIPCWVAALGVISGGLYESRSLSGMIGVNAADNVRKYSQYSRWTGSYIWTLFRASFIAPLGLLAGGALLAGLSIFYHWNDVLDIYQRLHAGAVGDTAITFLQLGILPNLVVYSMSYSTGAGFALGQGSAINWDGAQVGSLPLLPLLGSTPTATAPWSYFTVAVPVLAGLLAGWWFFREGEDHLDEWLSLKIRFRPISWVLSHLALALLMGVISGVWVGLLGWASHGSLGLGKFTDIGAQPVHFGLLAALWFALGIFFGALFGRLIERDAKVALTRESDDVLLSKNTDEDDADSASDKKSKKRRVKVLSRFSKKNKKAEETATDDSETDDSDADEAESKTSKKKTRTSSANATALHQILNDEDPEDDSSEDDTDESTENKKTEPAETPWWEKHTLIRYSKDDAAQDSAEQTEKSAEETSEEASDETKPDAETETEKPADSSAEESEEKAEKPAETKPAKPKTPRLSRGTVIRRPKAKKKTEDSDAE